MTAKVVSAENIVRSLVKVRLMICHWNGKYVSQTLSNEIERQKKAESGSVDANVVYLPERYSKPVTVAVSRMRTYWNDYTLPWENDSWRIVPSRKYQTLMDGAVERKHTFEEAVKAIIDNYNEVLEASKVRLSTLFDPKKFPSKDQLEAKYGIYLYRNSVNAANDVRIDGLGDAIVADIRRDVASQYNDQICMAVESIIARLREVATDIVDRTSKPAEGLKFSTLLAKIKKTCDSLDGLNIIGDPRIDSLVMQMREIAKQDADTLRVNESIRMDMKDQATSMLTALDTFAG